MTKERFPDLPKGYVFPELEREVLGEWRRNEIFAKTLAKTAGGKPFVFYEGPPTANNVPHVGHVVTRAVKDLVPRYKTMRGHHVQRKAGWDTHGLPVEIEVEKKLGFSGKQDIERFGVEQFNRACFESVSTYERQWREMTERVGFWIDLDDAYFTYSNHYIESVWWALSRLHERSLLEKGYKIQPYCARCGTTLSSHEVAQNYQEADDPSIWALFEVVNGQTVETVDGETWQTPAGLYLVAWTTTPWTLLGHTGMAVSAGLVYKVVEDPRHPGRFLLFAEDLDNGVPCEFDDSGKRRRMDLRELPAVVRIHGADLEGLRYQRPYRPPIGERPETSFFDPPPSDENGWCVFTADYVTASEGTGIVHTAPAFGEDDHLSGRRLGLPLLLTIDSEGRIAGDGTEPFTSLRFKDADPQIIRDLKDRESLLHSERYKHNYPFCWRCDEPLLYYASVSWFVRTTAKTAKKALIERNRDEITWHPRHVGEGRFGKWLEAVVDWALSRKRYWGTPLPVWECDACDHMQVIGSFTELFESSGRLSPEDVYDRTQFDPHRPFVDRDAPGAAFTWACPRCEKGLMGRVEEVIDAWFDSGSMPFAQHHFTGTRVANFDPDANVGFPADFIAEAVDQTRGWFYTLHVLGVLLFDQAAFKDCIVLGHINDEKGRKMSKRIGNVVDPMTVIEETGADALRWYFYISNPELTSRFSAKLVREAAQKFLLPLWNAVSFFTIYANLDGWRPQSETLDFSVRPELDRWILLRLDRLTESLTENLDSYRIVESAREIESFIDDLTNWYIRRSRDRFWASSDQKAGDENDEEKESAYQTLYEVLCSISRLIAPFTPFVADVLHRHLERSQETKTAASVHLEDWPRTRSERRDDPLEQGMAAIQRIVRLGHAARNDHSLKIRQPLGGVTVVTSDAALRAAVEPHVDVLLQELNVHELHWAKDRTVYVHHEVRPNFPKCGPRFGKQMKSLQRTLAAADGDALAAELEEHDRVRIELDGETVELSAGDVEVRLIEREGTATQGDRGLLVALDTDLTDELVGEGRAREIINRVQAARKVMDLDYADRISLRYSADDEIARVIDMHGEWISRETLTMGIEKLPTSSPNLESRPIDDLAFAFEIERL
jgi:isoleucyl-tRNA synthetase